MYLLNRLCQYKAYIYKDNKSNFASKSMLFTKFKQAHAAFGRGICHLLWWLFFIGSHYPDAVSRDAVYFHTTLSSN